MDKHGKAKFYVFLLLLLAIIIGGYILMKKSKDFSLEPKKIQTIDVSEENKEIRNDPTKDYIYFEDTKVINDELNIEFSKIVLNFYDKNSIATSLNNENAQLESSIKYEGTEGEYDNLSAASYKTYDIYYYQNYISLVVKYFNYAIDTQVTFDRSKSYVFDKNTGDLITKEELLKMFSLSDTDVVEKVKSSIEDKNLLSEEELDAQATSEAVNTEGLYIDKMGKLSLEVLVKSASKSYNDTIILN